MSTGEGKFLRPHKNSSLRQTFEMPGGDSEGAHQSTTHETYRPPKTVDEKPLTDKGYYYINIISIHTYYNKSHSNCIVCVKSALEPTLTRLESCVAILLLLNCPIY